MGLAWAVPLAKLLIKQGVDIFKVDKQHVLNSPLAFLEIAVLLC